MAGSYTSNRAAVRRQFAGQVGGRVKAAAVRLSSEVKADISQPGTLRYHPIGKNGKALKTQKTVYHFTHSRPFNPPFKQSGNLRKSIAWAPAGPLVARVGSNLKAPKYPLYLELGTKKMKHRSFLRAGLKTHAGTLRKVLTGALGPGGLAPVVSNQFRPGHFGRGAKSSGWA